MIIYIDDNIPPYVAKAFDLLQAPQNLKHERSPISVKHIRDVFGRGAKDLEWIPAIAGENAFVITQDISINRRKDEIAAYQDNGIGMFFLRGKNSKDTLTAFEMIEILARQWEAMVKIMYSDDRPFACKVQRTGKPKRF